MSSAAPPDPSAELKRLAAEKAVEAIESGMAVGLGTGSTAAFAVAAIGRLQREKGLRIRAIPTSEATAAQAREQGIALTDFATEARLDLTIDGADAVDLSSFALIKGLGGALLREKIVAAASRRMIVIVDETKIAGPLGSRTPVPVEIVRFGWQATERRVAALGANPALRHDRAGAPFVSDGGNYILDCAFGPVADPVRLEVLLTAIPGVVESGLFNGLATEVIVAGAGGTERFARA